MVGKDETVTAGGKGGEVLTLESACNGDIADADGDGQRGGGCRSGKGLSEWFWGQWCGVGITLVRYPSPLFPAVEGGLERSEAEPRRPSGYRAGSCGHMPFP